uniref:Pepsin inhibitor-3-like repeated domain-containing protein n=1 Tax=Acrobeloides nanus TaxID=290746 RepID=A0A914DNW1_9BILA
MALVFLVVLGVVFLQIQANPIRNVVLNNQNCSYQNDRVYENGTSRLMTEEEKEKLEEYLQKMKIWNDRVKEISEKFATDMVEKIFTEKVTMAPWPEFPQLSCFCSHCQ